MMETSGFSLDWPLLVGLLLPLYLAFRGYRAGWLASIARLVSLLAGYLAAFLFSAKLATPLGKLIGLEGIAALLCASLLLFIGTALLVGLAFRGATLLPGGRAGPSPAGRVGGAALGLLNGVLLAIVVIWSAGFLRDLYSAGDIDAAAPTAPSTTARLVDEVADFALGKALEIADVDPGVAQISSALIKSPDQILGLAMRLAHSPHLTALLGDPRNHPTLDSGDIGALQELHDFQQLAAEPDLRRLMQAIRMVDGTDEGAYAMLLAGRISDLWLRTRAVERDPRVLAILGDANFRRNLDAGNPLALVNDSQLLELAQIVMNAEPAPPVPLEVPSAETGTVGQKDEVERPRKTPREPARIYRWTDDSGRLIYSDKPRPQ